MKIRHSRFFQAEGQMSLIQNSMPKHQSLLGSRKALFKEADKKSKSLSIPCHFSGSYLSMSSRKVNKYRVAYRICKTLACSSCRKSCKQQKTKQQNPCSPAGQQYGGAHSTYGINSGSGVAKYPELLVTPCQSVPESRGNKQDESWRQMKWALSK